MSKDRSERNVRNGKPTEDIMDSVGYEHRNAKVDVLGLTT
jgi:hypothetical protein